MARKRRLGMSQDSRRKLLNRLDDFCANNYNSKPQAVACIFGGKRAAEILLDQPSLLEGKKRRR